MMTLIVLFVSLLVFRGLGVLEVPPFLTWHDSALWALAVMVLFTAGAHFTALKEDLVKMVPTRNAGTGPLGLRWVNHIDEKKKGVTR